MKKFTIACLISITSLFAHSPANAASSKWFDTKGAKMRLITAVRPESKTIDAALEVKLEKGWKTYWRSPGESGIPPYFDFSASSNILDAKVMFPTPTYFNKSGIEAVGYKKHVVFPIQLKLSSADKPTILQLKTVIGICGEVCIPVQAKLKVTEPGNLGPTFDVSRALNDAKASIPSKPNDKMKVVSARWNQDNPTKLSIETIVSDAMQQVQLHVEGPDDWYLLPAKLVERKANKALFELDISDIPENANPANIKLRFTLVADGRGIEQELSTAQ